MARRMDKERVARVVCGGFPLGMGLESVPLGDGAARMLRYAAAMRRLGFPGCHAAALCNAKEMRLAGASRVTVAIGTR